MPGSTASRSAGGRAVFDEALSAVLERIEGARAVVLTGADGMVLAASRDEGPGAPPIDVLAACYADLYKRVAAAHGDSGLAPPVEMCAGSRHGTVLLRAVASSYLLVAVLGPASVPGKARFELRRAADRLAPELL